LTIVMSTTISRKPVQRIRSESQRERVMHCRTQPAAKTHLLGPIQAHLSGVIPEHWPRRLRLSPGSATPVRSDTLGHPYAPRHVVHRIHRVARGGASVDRGDCVGCFTRGMVLRVFSGGGSIPVPSQPSPGVRRRAGQVTGFAPIHRLFRGSFRNSGPAERRRNSRAVFIGPGERLFLFEAEEPSETACASY